MAQAVGIEPTFMDLETIVLPLDETYMVVQYGIEPSSNDYQSFALPLSYRTIFWN